MSPQVIVLITEDTKLRHFSAILQEAQRLAIQVQRDMHITQKQQSQTKGINIMDIVYCHQR
jgi:hypothetical protein